MQPSASKNPVMYDHDSLAVFDAHRGSRFSSASLDPQRILSNALLGHVAAI